MENRKDKTTAGHSFRFKLVVHSQVLAGGISSSPIGPSDIMKKETAFPIGYILPGGFQPVLGIAWMKKSRAGGAENSGHLCHGSTARSVARRVYR